MVYVLNKYGSLHDHLHDGEFYCALQHFSQLVPHVPVNIWIINSYGMACASLALVIVTNFGRYVSAHTAVSHRSGGNFHRFGHLLLCDGVKKNYPKKRIVCSSIQRAPTAKRHNKIPTGKYI